MSIISTGWNNTNVSILEALQKIREQALKTSIPITDAYTAAFGSAELGMILVAVEYGRQLDKKQLAKEKRRRKKRYTRYLRQKGRQ